MANGIAERTANDASIEDLIDAERWLLGSYFQRLDLMDNPSTLVSAGDFYSEHHASAFRALEAMCDTDITPDERVFSHLLRDMGVPSDQIGEILLLVKSIPHTASAEYHAKIIKEAAANRRIVAALKVALAVATDPHATTEDRAAELDRLADISSGAADASKVSRYTIGDLLDKNPCLHPPVVDGIIRQGETCNIVSSSKVGKSWLAYGLALSVATGRDWLDTFPTERGKVLLIDNELHAPTIANRIPRVCEAMGIDLGEIRDKLEVMPLRGNLRDLVQLGGNIRRLKRGDYKLVILDAWYRAIPPGASENDNAAVANLYNRLDQYAERTGAAFCCIHHSSKGGQSDKRVTDVGSGAGSQSRATDCHLVLREHEDDGAVVLDAAVRSFAPVDPLVLRWEFPTWRPDGEADPSALRRPKSRRDDQQDRDDMSGQGAILDALEFPLTRSRISDLTGFGRSKTQRLVGQLIRGGFIEETNIEVRGKTETAIRKALKSRD